MSPTRAFLVLVAAMCLALGLGGWMRRSSVDAGFWADDYMQHAMLEGHYPSERAAWDLFHFVDGRPEDHKRIVDYGVDPWWTHPEFRLSLLRPLPSLARALDHQVFGLNAVPQHVHSMLWWALLVVVVGALFHSTLPPLAAAIALVLFALDESHTVPVLWLSNRSALMATFFATAALVSHIHWRRRPEGKAWRAASVVLCALALGSGEYALASLGYLACFELVQTAPRVSRSRALAPFAGLTLAFLGTSAALGYGSAHSALYTSPFSAPLDYAAKALPGFPVMLGELIAGIPADWYSFGSPWPHAVASMLQLDPATWDRLPSWRTWQVALGLFSGLVAALLLWWVRARGSRGYGSAPAWFVLGVCLGVLPVLGSFITTRLALPSSIGFAALYGCVCSEGLSVLARPRSADHDEPVRTKVGRAAAFALCGLVLFVHGYRAYVQGENTTNFYGYISHSRTAWPQTAAIDDSKAASQRVVMIAAADANDAPHLPFVRAALGHPLVRGFRLLSGAPGAHAITRVDDTTLEVRVADELGLDASVAGSLTRTQADILSPNDKAHVEGLDVTVLETLRGQPTRMRFRFDAPLEDASLVFLQSTVHGLELLALPPIGGTVLLPPPTMPDLAQLQPR